MDSKEKNQELKRKVLAEMRQPELYRDKVLKYVEKYIADAFNYSCRKKLSINEWQPDSRYSGQLGQKTVMLTVRIFDLWENAIVEVLREHFSKTVKNVRVERVNDPIGDMVIIFPNKEEMRWEIKSSQAENSFTGATHSASKCNNYILINYGLNKKLKLTNKKYNRGIIKSLAIFVWDNMEAKWLGEPSKHSSFTTLRIPAEIAQKRPEIVVLGKLVSKQKWCKIIR